MAYTLTRAAEIIGVSRATIFRKVKTFSNQLGDELKDIDGAQSLTDKGIDILKKCLGIIEDTVSRDSHEGINKVSDRIFEMEISHLRQILEMKDREIQKLESRIQLQDEMIQSLISDQSRQQDQYQQLMGNFQVLLKQSNLLEDPEQKRSSIFGWFTRKK